MKKPLCLILAIVLMLVSAGCSDSVKDGGASTNGEESSIQSEAPQQSEISSPEESVNASEFLGEADLVPLEGGKNFHSKYTIEIDGTIIFAGQYGELALFDAESGKAVKTLYLPKGKKPLILTFDDVTYDFRKQGSGMVDKLIVDEDGYVCTYTKMADGTEVISYDNEHFPVLNAYVREHPDFTFRGARGTLFFTGFDGILGYRTQSEPINAAEAALKLDRNAEIEGAKKVLAALSAEGWTYGSHSYNHRHMPRYTVAEFKEDTDMWLREVGSLVGETQLFCWPYGDHGSGSLRKGDLHKYLYDSGFRIFFGCGSARYVAQEPDGLGIFTDRKGMTGNVLYYIEMEYKAYLRDYLYLIDPDKMWDPLRLPYKYKPPYKSD